MDSLAEFIAEHYGDDPDRLALQREKWPWIDVLAAVSTLVSRRKLAGKAPVWATAEGLVLPRTLSAEQCSGEAAARHKAQTIREFLKGNSKDCADASEILHGGVSVSGDGGNAGQNAGAEECRWRIADLTGGLGVDCLEFSKVAEAVLYNDMLPVLAEAAEHNFRVLGAGNIEVCCAEVSPRTLGADDEGGSDAKDADNDCPKRNSMTECDKSDEGVCDFDGGLRERLDAFRPDVIYLDPARRDGCGRKVFLLEDCSPDILKIKNILLDIAPVLAMKLSPMADISMVLERLGDECRELQVIEAGGECKELLVLMRRDEEKLEDCLIKVYNLNTREGGDKENESPVFEFRRDEENDGTGLRLAESEEIVPGALLFEPGKALMKAGCFRLIGRRLCAPVLGRDTHYYILSENTCILSENTPDPATAAFSATGTSSATGNSSLTKISSATDGEHFSGYHSLKDSGKLFRILDVREMSAKALKDFGRSHPEAEVTARNVRMTSEELRRRLGCKSSDCYHTFALHADKPGKKLLLFTERI